MKKDVTNFCQESVTQYLNSISNKYEQNIVLLKNLLKIKDEEIIISSNFNYNQIIQYNYNLSQLKIFIKHYKLKISGNKNELMKRIYVFLYLSSHIVKIQKRFRGNLQRKLNMFHGPAYMNRKLCTNNTDFVTMEPIEEILFNQFISYKDVDDFIYGFDIVSLYNLFLKGEKEFKNPYNRNMIPEYVFKNIKLILRLSRLLKIYVNLHFEDDSINVSGQKAIELRTLSLFQNIDALGNYSSPQWFLSLNKNKLIKFIRELCDIFNYRAQLSLEVKRSICPPTGDPFINLCFAYIQAEQDINNIRKVILEVLEKLVNNGTDSGNKSLGAYYVLGALTLVNENAATMLPWLFQSVSYI